MLVRGLLALVALAVVHADPVEEKRGDEAVFSIENGIYHHSPELTNVESYASGAVHMMLMDRFKASIKKMEDLGLFDEPITHKDMGFMPCVNGYAGTKTNNTFMCKSLDLHSFTSHASMGSDVKQGNDIWGWTSPDGREFALVGQRDGTAFMEINDDGTVTYVGRLPTQTWDGMFNLWRDIKVIKGFMYVGSEAEGHGIQVFDLSKLLDTKLREEPKNFTFAEMTAHYGDFAIGASHNVVAHEEKELIVAVGSRPRNDTCKSGLIFVDVSDPTNPKGVGCASEDGYTHDAQCLTYHGPDARYEGTDVCYGYNENSLTIINITDPSTPSIISSTAYYGVSYSHQGWVVDPADQRYLLLDDELDEVQQAGWAEDEKTVTYIWDIQDLEKPVLTGHYKSPARAIDHNLYVHQGWAYESNYGSGLRVVDVSSVTKDPTGAGFSEVAFFDVHPEDDDVGGIAEFSGAWSVYPYFESGYIAINSIERGLFVVKYSG